MTIFLAIGLKWSSFYNRIFKARTLIFSISSNYNHSNHFWNWIINIAGISQLSSRLLTSLCPKGPKEVCRPRFLQFHQFTHLMQFAFEFELESGRFGYGFFLLTWRHFVRNCAHGNCLICGQFCLARCLAPLWPQPQQKQQQQQQQELGQLFNCLNRHLQRFLAMTSCSFWFVFFLFCLFWKIGSQLANLFAISRTCFVRFDFVTIILM